MEGTETHGRWLRRATVYAVSMTLAGGVSGLAFAAAGSGVEAFWEDAQAPLAVALGAVSLVYALHELEFVRLPVPGRDWQVPASWVRRGFYRSAAIFGSVVGFGVFTRVPFASLPILLAWLFVSGNILSGALAGLVYGAARALSIYASASTTGPEELVELNRSIMRLAGPAHQLTGVMLAAFAGYLLLATSL